MRVLVDTSVWIRRFSRKEPFSTEVDRLMADGETVAHELIYGELLIGDRGGREQFLEDYRRVPRVISVPHDEVIEFVRMRRLHGRGIGWIDAHLLASALAARAQFWTADTRLAAIADELGVAYKPR